MRTVFADASYWIALLNPRDNLHTKAKTVSGALGNVRFLTSEMVLAEFLNDFARRGGQLRKLAATWVKQLRTDPNTTIVEQSSLLFHEALALYETRSDKDWGLTDCASFSIMREYGVSDALTADSDFRQAGFTALLRDD
jgi:predicted nucleic acid-binding protein